jgi:prolyl oligopeptidase
MRHEKQHVFDDFEAVAEFLAAEKYTRADRLVIYGGSNGGLLMGAALTQRPELYRVVVCGVPLLDMVRYQRFGAGRTWTEEYGNAENAADFAALYAYSPYHHVTPGTAYPSLLLEASDSDDRVDGMHGRKFVAAVQAASTGGPVLLRVEARAGHGGNARLQSFVERGADRIAFALAEVRKTGSAMQSAPR